MAENITSFMDGPLFSSSSDSVVVEGHGDKSVSMTSVCDCSTKVSAISDVRQMRLVAVDLTGESVLRFVQVLFIIMGQQRVHRN